MKSLLFLTFLLVLLSVVTSCPQGSSHDELELTDTQIAATLDKTTTNASIPLKSYYVIELPSNPTTGYTWRLSENVTSADSSSLAFCRYVRSSSLRGIRAPVGGGGVERWAFKGDKAGIHKIELIYGRPWEKITSAGNQKQTFTVKVGKQIGKLKGQNVREVELDSAVEEVKQEEHHRPKPYHPKPHHPAKKHHRPSHHRRNGHHSAAGTNVHVEVRV